MERTACYVTSCHQVLWHIPLCYTVSHFLFYSCATSMRPRSKSHCANVDDTSYPIPNYRVPWGCSRGAHAGVHYNRPYAQQSVTKNTLFRSANMSRRVSGHYVQLCVYTSAAHCYPGEGGKNTPAWGPSNDGACTDCVGTNYYVCLVAGWSPYQVAP